jgi:Flp pilus assembly protein CpaB
VLTALSIIMTRSRIEASRVDAISRTSPREIVVASRPIQPGDTFSALNLAKKSIPESGTGKRNIPAEEFGLLMNARSRGEIEPGEPVLWTDVEEPFEPDSLSQTIARGHRALTLDVNSTSSFAGLLRTGDKVDFLCKPGNVWIRNISVLAVDRQFNKTGSREAENVTTVTLSVTPSEGTKLASGAHDGTLSWFLRNPADNEVIPIIFDRPPRNPVEIWKGGVPEHVGYSGTVLPR